MLSKEQVHCFLTERLRRGLRIESELAKLLKEQHVKSELFPMRALDGD